MKWLLLLGAAACSAPPPGGFDGAVEDGGDGGLVDAGATPLCADDGGEIDCPFSTLTLTAGGYQRPVHYQLPRGTAPDAGWPALVFYQGSFFSGAQAFSARTSDAFGRFYEAAMVEKLLGGGYAVLAPDSRGGATYWDTNVPPWSTNWSSAPDAALVDAMLTTIAAGGFGPLDTTHLYAAGISSGGYMTSRMAVSYPGRFRALAIASASYATCGGNLCAVPALPADHPPTLFLHGRQDAVVPVATMQAYHDALVALPCPTQEVINETAGHQFLPEAPDAILLWLQAHP